MSPGQSSKRPRGHRGNGRRSGGGRNSSFESNGPQGKIRGTAYQVIEKYQALGRDALTFGDRVAAENYFQHAEHYYRVLAANGGLDQRSGRNSGQSHARSGQQQNQSQKPQNSEELAKVGAEEGELVSSDGGSSPSTSTEEVSQDEAVTAQVEADSSTN